MCNNQKILDQILLTKNGIHVNSVHFVNDDIFNKNENEKLISIGLDLYEPIYFSVEGLNYTETSQSCPSLKRHGATICVKRDFKIDYIILIRKHVQKELEVPIELQSEWRAIVYLIALLHELGHIEDMQNSINFNLSVNPIVKLVEAEAYAYVYALNHLNHLGASIARDTLSASLYKLVNSTSEFDKSLIKLIFKSIGKDRLYKWAFA